MELNQIRSKTEPPFTDVSLQAVAPTIAQIRWTYNTTSIVQFSQIKVGKSNQLNTRQSISFKLKGKFIKTKIQFQVCTPPKRQIQIQIQIHYTPNYWCKSARFRRTHHSRCHRQGSHCSQPTLVPIAMGTNKRLKLRWFEMRNHRVREVKCNATSGAEDCHSEIRILRDPGHLAHLI